MLSNLQGVVSESELRTFIQEKCLFEEADQAVQYVSFKLSEGQALITFRDELLANDAVECLDG